MIVEPSTTRKKRPSRASITLDYLKTVLEYNAETGEFTWLGHLWAGKRAGTINSNGYIKIAINRVDFKAHRLAWAFSTGKMPPSGMHIDHINGIPTDNRIANLRLCTAKQNCENAKKHKSNTTGLKGVATVGKKFRAYICHNRRQIHLGCFETSAEAHAAYCSAAQALGWQVHRRA